MLSKEEYNELEAFVSNESNKCRDNSLSISGRDLQFGKKIYKDLKSTIEPTYEIFGSDGCGYTCYSLYKSQNKKIYFILVQIQTLSGYIEVETEEWFN